MEPSTVSIYFLNAAIQNLQNDPVLIQRILVQNGISPSSLDNPEARLPADAFADCLRDLMQAAGDEQLGHGSDRQPLGSWATMAQLCISAGTLGEALRRLTRFYRLIPWGVTTRMHVEDNKSNIVMAPDANYRFSPYIFESFLFYVYRFSNWLIGEKIPLIGVHFCFPEPPHRDEYRDLFFTNHFRFNSADSRLVFARSFLDRPLVQTPDSLAAFLSHTNRSMFAPTATQRSWHDRLQEQLVKRLEENPTIDEIASDLGVHPHTLRKNLGAEGFTFQGIREQLRRDISLQLLIGEKLSVEQAALRLGYSETSAFSRAFRKWMGLSPQRYEKSLDRR